MDTPPAHKRIPQILTRGNPVTAGLTSEGMAANHDY